MDYINRLLHRKSPNTSNCTSPELNVNDVSPKTTPEYEIKVKFAREFGNVVNYPPPPPSIITENSISSASSFQSIGSTLSTKSSSGICVDSETRSSDVSYENVLDLDELISACAAINLNDTTATTVEQSSVSATSPSANDEVNETKFRSRSVSPNSNFNDTQIINPNFDITELDCERLNSVLNTTQTINSENIDDNVNEDICTKVIAEQQISPDYATASETLFQSVSLLDNIEKVDNKLNNNSTLPLPPEATNQFIASSPVPFEIDPSETQELTAKSFNISSSLQSSTLPTLESILLRAESACQSPENVERENSDLDLSQSSLQTLPIAPVEHSSSENIVKLFSDITTNDIVETIETSFLKTENFLDETKLVLTEPIAQSIIVQPETSKEDDEIYIKQSVNEINELATEVTNQVTDNINSQLNSLAIAEIEQIKTEIVTAIVPVEEELTIKTPDNIDNTVNIPDIQTNVIDATEALHHEEFTTKKQNTINEEIPPEYVEYDNFLPQRQSTCINNLISSDSYEELSSVSSNATAEPEFFDAQNISISDNQINIEQLKLKKEKIVNDICNTSLELVYDNEHCSTASLDLWRDPTNFDFLLSKKSNSATTDRLRAESLYVKFDPLVSDSNMLPQGNGATAPPNEERNGEKEVSVPNIGTPKHNPAIAAIDRLLFYSPMSPANQKSGEAKKIEPTEKTTPEPIPFVDSAMAKELELVRATVLQLEEQLRKQKLEHEEQEKEDKKDREAFQQETITQLQKQLNQEIKSKNQMNVVIDEYEKSISRLVAERERDRKNLDVEKTSLLEELQEVKNHLSASEAAFNDVHAKYERLKVVVTASKNNEAALKASIAENVEIIKTLEDRYDQIKTHAAVRLEKANLELEGIRKQHESETLKLRAMLRKEELKSSSLAEMIEQKTKENKELTKILDEVIARVDSGTDK